MVKGTSKQECLGQLQAAIEELHKCGATHRRTVPVHEVFKGKTLWKGLVEVFWLTGHPRAKRCYAWYNCDELDEDTPRYVIVLEVPPVIGPATAVKAAIAEARGNRKPTGTG